MIAEFRYCADIEFIEYNRKGHGCGIKQQNNAPWVSWINNDITGILTQVISEVHAVPNCLTYVLFVLSLFKFIYCIGSSTKFGTY